MDLNDSDPRRREPVFSRDAPWTPILLAVTLVGLYLLQGVIGDRALIERYALIPELVTGAGEWGRLLSHLFLHGGWTHVLLNAVFALAFGAGVIRFLGRGAAGAGAFLLFFLACGALAGAAFVLLHPSGYDPVVGASGGVAGLMAAASRLIEEPGRLAGWRSRPVIAMAAGWLAINVVAAVLGTLPGAGGAAIAWEAHLAGYLAGFLLIGPASRLVGSSAPR